MLHMRIHQPIRYPQQYLIWHIALVDAVNFLNERDVKDSLATDVVDAVFDAMLKPLLKRLKDPRIAR